MPRAPSFSPWLCLAHHSPLSPKAISTEVCARSTPVFALGFEAKKRFSLSVLNYVVTSNHVHLLVKDAGEDVIADSMQLIAGRSEYNQRKRRPRRILGRPLSRDGRG
jgi:hypothetical protein